LVEHHGTGIDPVCPCHATERDVAGKLTELAVRAVVHGEPAGNAEALANPEVLGHFRDRVELTQP